MKIINIQNLLLILIPIISSCSTMDLGQSSYLPNTFTTENIMKVHQGMTSTEILKMFGNPKNISQSSCGGSTGHPWLCITWEYGKYPYDKASFTFNGNHKPAVLNDFDIDREEKGEKLPESFSAENIMNIPQDDSSSLIVKTFGTPKNVSQSVCGSGTGKPWTCTTWEYGNFPYERASFTFSGNHGSYILNDFKVEKD